jgi:hypothetical protein
LIVAIQILTHWEDPEEFPYGPYVAREHQTTPGLYRIENKLPGDAGLEILDYEPRGWKPLEDVTSAIEDLNESFHKRMKEEK